MFTHIYVYIYRAICIYILCSCELATSKVEINPRDVARQESMIALRKTSKLLVPSGGDMAMPSHLGGGPGGPSATCIVPYSAAPLSLQRAVPVDANAGQHALTGFMPQISNPAALQSLVSILASSMTGAGNGQFGGFLNNGAALHLLGGHSSPSGQQQQTTSNQQPKSPDAGGNTDADDSQRTSPGPTEVPDAAQQVAMMTQALAAGPKDTKAGKKGGSGGGGDADSSDGGPVPLKRPAAKGDLKRPAKASKASKTTSSAAATGAHKAMKAMKTMKVAKSAKKLTRDMIPINLRKKYAGGCYKCRYGKSGCSPSCYRARGEI